MRAVPQRLAIVCLVVAAAAASAGAPAAPTEARAAAGRPAFTLRRDAFGVAHIYASTDAGLFFGSGYATGQDRLFQLDLYRRSALGQLAEIFGPSLLESDRLERTRGYTAAEYQAQIDALAPAERLRLEAYRDGINASIDEALADPAPKLPFEFHALGYRPAPWTVRDTLAVGRFTVRRFGEFGGTELENQADFQALAKTYGPDTETVFNDWWWLNDSKAPTTIPAGTGGAGTGGAGTGGAVTNGAGANGAGANGAGANGNGANGAGAVGVESLGRRSPPMHLEGVGQVADRLKRRSAAAEAGWASVGMPSRLGSFAMLVAPSRSASGRPILYYGPQMGFEYPDIIYEQHLVGGDGGRFDVFGAGVPGLGGPAIGQNRYFAWGFTSGYADNIDIFAERLDPEHPNQYLYRGAWRPVEVRDEPISVRTSPVGQAITTISVANVVTRTVHGPVIAADLEHHLAYSERREMWMKEAAFLSVDLATADSLDAVRTAIDAFPASFNVHVATTDGHIGYFHASHIPQRADGSYVGRFPWPGDGSADWREALRPIASVVDPAQGWLANWNNRPDGAFANGDSVRFGTQHRVERLFGLLGAKVHVTRGDLDGIAKDLAVLNPFNGPGLNTMHLLEPMLAAVRAGASGDARLGAVADRLAAWDGHFATDAVASTTLSPEYTIWNEWWPLAATAVFSDEWGAAGLTATTQHLIHAFEGRTAGVPPTRDYFDDTDTTDVVETSPQLMVASLRTALGDLAARFGTEDIDRWVIVRGVDEFRHPLLGTLGPTIPRSNRSTWIFIAEPGSDVPSQSLVPSGTSAFLRLGPGGLPVVDAHALDQRLRFARWGDKSTAAPPWLVFIPSLQRD